MIWTIIGIIYFIIGAILFFSASAMVDNMSKADYGWQLLVSVFWPLAIAKELWEGLR